MLIIFITSQVLARVNVNYIPKSGTLCCTTACLLFAVPIKPKTTYQACGFPAMCLCVVGANTLFPLLVLFVAHSLPKEIRAAEVDVQESQFHSGDAAVDGESIYLNPTFLAGLRVAEWFSFGVILSAFVAPPWLSEARALWARWRIRYALIRLDERLHTPSCGIHDPCPPTIGVVGAAMHLGIRNDSSRPASRRASSPFPRVIYRGICTARILPLASVRHACQAGPIARRTEECIRYRSLQKIPISTYQKVADPDILSTWGARARGTAYQFRPSLISHNSHDGPPTAEV